MSVLRVIYKISTANSGGRSWDEQIYYEDSFAITVGTLDADRITTYAIRRALCLPRGCRILFARVNVVDFPTIVRQIDLNLPGVLGVLGTTNADLVNVSRKFQCRASSGRRAEFLSRCPADGDVVGGVFTYAENGEAPYSGWSNQFAEVPFKIRTSNFAAGIAITVVEELYFHSAAPIVTVKGDVWNVKTRVIGSGPRVYTNVVAQGPQGVDGRVPILGWPHGSCVGGSVRKVTYTYNDIISVSVPSPIGRTRKTGGPFTKFRGRR